MKSIEPVVANCSFMRMVLGAGQPEYSPLNVAAVVGPAGGIAEYGQGPIMVSRHKLTDEDRKMIAEGGDIYLCQLTCGQLYQPTSLAIVPDAQALDCGHFE